MVAAMVEPTFKTKEGTVTLDELKKRGEDLKVKIGILTGTGVHPSSSFRSNDAQVDTVFAGGKGEEATFAQILFWLEHGQGKAPGYHIFKRTFFTHKIKYRSMIRNLTQNVLLGKISKDNAEAVLGFAAQNDIQYYMKITNTPANSERTQVIKGSKVGEGVKINNPMIDTGLTINKIKWASVGG